MEIVETFIRGGFAILILVIICTLLSKDRKNIDWTAVLIGLGFQLVLAFSILKISFINNIFEKIAGIFTKLISVSDAGATFMFGWLVSERDTYGHIFAFNVLPTILFFSALFSILYYLGVLQIIVKVMAWIMAKAMGLTGPESLAAAANVFIGQTEAPLIVKPYLEKMNQSEIMCLMTGGMATIAGGVFAAYIGYLGGSDEALKLYYAKHILTASIISAPAAIVAAKILVPADPNEDKNQSFELESLGYDNILDAIAKGTTDGLKLAVNVAVMLVVFTALIALLNKTLLFLSPQSIDDQIIASTDGRFPGLTFTYLLGLIFAPFAWLLGTPNQDIILVGQLLGQKTMINEFVAYAEIKNMANSGIVLHEKSKLIATYALCGFANFASIGIQIGGIGAIAPGQRKTLTSLGFYSLIGGTIACFFTAAIAGIIWAI